MRYWRYDGDLVNSQPTVRQVREGEKSEGRTDGGCRDRDCH